MSKQNLALLEYTFMFDPSDAWSSLYQFESTLSKFFDSLGLEAQVVKAIEGGNSKRMLLLTPKPEPKEARPTKVSSPKDQLSKVRG